MYADVVLCAFEKAALKPGLETPWQQAEYISDKLLEESSLSYSARSLTNKLNSINAGDRNISIRRDVIDALSKFLGYEDYEVLLNEHPEINPHSGSSSNKKSPRKRLIITISISFLLIIGYAIYHFNQPRFMVWKGTYYEEVELDLEKYPLQELKAFKEDRIENFRKVDPDCTYDFFDDDGLELIWYGKNREGEYEFFTDLGRHPVTGKTLKKITPYMIQKYICPTYPD